MFLSSNLILEFWSTSIPNATQMHVDSIPCLNTWQLCLDCSCLVGDVSYGYDWCYVVQDLRDISIYIYLWKISWKPCIYVYIYCIYIYIYILLTEYFMNSQFGTIPTPQKHVCFLVFYPFFTPCTDFFLARFWTKPVPSSTLFTLKLGSWTKTSPRHMAHHGWKEGMVLEMKATSHKNHIKKIGTRKIIRIFKWTLFKSWGP